MRWLNTLLLLGQIALLVGFMRLPLPSAQSGPNCDAPIAQPEHLELYGQTYHYRYDAQGRVLSRRGEFEEIQFQYVQQHNRPIYITRLYGSSDQSAWVRLEWHFIYNDQQQLIYVRDENRREAWYGYNDHHDMVWIENENGKRLEITRDAACGKPKQLRVAEVGFVSVKYDAQCELLMPTNRNEGDWDRLLLPFLYAFDLLDAPDLDVFH